MQKRLGVDYIYGKEESLDPEQPDGETYVTAYEVYKVDFVGQKIIETNNLQDHAMFIGFNNSFLLPVKDFPALVPNSIYHTDDLLRYIYSHRYSLRRVVVFNMEDSGFIELSPPSSNSRLNWPPPVWIQPSLT